MRKTGIYPILIVFFQAILCLEIQGQDLLFSQYYSAPMAINPALTGGFGGKYRVSAIYRDQWRGPLERPIGSFGAGIDLRFDLPFDNRSEDAAGVGVQFITDQASSVDLSTNIISLSGAFHKSLATNRNKFLSAGFQLSTGQRNILYEGLVFQDQFNGIDAFDGATGEVLPANNFGFSDLSAGLNFVTSTSNNDFQLFTGLAMHHILEPQFSFYGKDSDQSQQEGYDSRLKRKILWHAGSTIRTGEDLRISPRIFVVAQGESMRAHVGSNFIIEPSSTDAFNFHVGGWLALVRDFDATPQLDAMGFLIGLGMGDLLVGLSYDLNLRDVVNYSSGQGAFELSISYFGNYEDDGGACPTF